MSPNQICRHPGFITFLNTLFNVVDDSFVISFLFQLHKLPAILEQVANWRIKGAGTPQLGQRVLALDRHLTETDALLAKCNFSFIKNCPDLFLLKRIVQNNNNGFLLWKVFHDTLNAGVIRMEFRSGRRVVLVSRADSRRGWPDDKSISEEREAPKEGREEGGFHDEMVRFHLPWLSFVGNPNI